MRCFHDLFEEKFEKWPDLDLRKIIGSSIFFLKFKKKLLINLILKKILECIQNRNAHKNKKKFQHVKLDKLIVVN